MLRGNTFHHELRLIVVLAWTMLWSLLPEASLALLVLQTKSGFTFRSSQATTSLYSKSIDISSKFAFNENLDQILREEPQLARQLYISSILWNSNDDWKSFMLSLRNLPEADHLWEQVKLEATTSLEREPVAGPLLYQHILSQQSLTEAVVTIVANEIETELIRATELKKLFLDSLTPEDKMAIHCDAIAAATRSPSVKYALLAVMFHTGYHALVCYRVGHRLWQQGRTGLAYYLQSTVSRQYSADIHPACRMGEGIYLCCSAGVVIGETATVGNDVCILHGVTLGGTGKQKGDRHPKVQHGVILEDSATVLGNISVGYGAIVQAKAIVNKQVPPLAIVSGVPAKIVAIRSLSNEAFQSDLERHLAFKYLHEWTILKNEMEDNANGTDKTNMVESETEDARCAMMHGCTAEPSL